MTLTLLALLLILAALGVDTKTALAGLGIGGVAVALGAQKTVENLLGGVFLLTDRALAVGDFCSISNRLGTVEDITLRSVRLRTLEQTLLSIPAGVLSQTGVENFSTRGKILVQATLRLRYGSTADQLKQILERTRKLLAAHADLEPESARIRLVNFGVSAIEIELFAYVADIRRAAVHGGARGSAAADCDDRRGVRQRVRRSDTRLRRAPGATVARRCRREREQTSLGGSMFRP